MSSLLKLGTSLDWYGEGLPCTNVIFFFFCEFRDYSLGIRSTSINLVIIDIHEQVTDVYVQRKVNLKLDARGAFTRASYRAFYLSIHYV